MPLSTNVQTKTNYLLMLSKLIFSPAVIAGNGKTQILVTFSATISFNLFPSWRKNWECIRLNWFVIILSL